MIVLLVGSFAAKGRETVENVPTAEPTATIEATIEPSAVPEITVEPTPENDIADENRAKNRPETRQNLLPVFKSADTEEKIIAITVDDCYQADNLRVIVDTAIQNGAKLTIFPIGKVAQGAEVREILKYAWENGMELENHTMNHHGLFDCTDEELAAQIYNQNLVLSDILGVEYQCHFLRPRGGDAKYDERIHKYIEQLGYKGVAHWNISGSGTGLRKLADGLKPGGIYLFHTTDKKDFAKLCKFIPYAISQGYKLVTLNEMFGYPPNETKPLTKAIDEYAAPTLAPYESYEIEMDVGTYDYRVLELQRRLLELGYLNTEPDGAYGEQTAAAVERFQKNAGLEPTGIADLATQKKLNADNAPSVAEE